MAKSAKAQPGAARRRAPARRTPRKTAPRSRGLEPKDCRLDTTSAVPAEVARSVEEEGGIVVGAYRDPLGGRPLVVAVLPIEGFGDLVI